MASGSLQVGDVAVQCRCHFNTVIYHNHVAVLGVGDVGGKCKCRLNAVTYQNYMAKGILEVCDAENNAGAVLIP